MITVHPTINEHLRQSEKNLVKLCSDIFLKFSSRISFKHKRFFCVWKEGGSTFTLPAIIDEVNSKSALQMNVVKNQKGLR